LQQAILAHCLAYRRFKGGAPVGQPNPFLAQQATDGVLKGDQLRLQGCARRQQSTMPLPLGRFDPDRPVLVDPHQIGDAARVVVVVLVAETGFERRCRVPRIDANLQSGKQPSCGATRLHADPLNRKPRRIAA